MNTALTRPAGSQERIVIGVVWLFLLVIWLLVDVVYPMSAWHARRKMEAIEKKDHLFPKEKFYTNQRETRRLKGYALSILLILSGIALAYLWFEVTWVWQDPPPGKIQILNTPNGRE